MVHFEKQKKHKGKVIAGLVCGVVVLLLCAGAVIFGQMYYKPRKACLNAEKYIEEEKYKDALEELEQAEGFGNSAELYEEAICGLNEKSYQEALKEMGEGELESAYDILSDINPDYISDKDAFDTSLKLVKEYKDSVWFGEWENSGFNTNRETRVLIKNNELFIELSFGSRESTEVVAFSGGTSVYMDDVEVVEGEMKLLNDNQLQIPHFSAPKGYYIWARVGSGAKSDYESPYEDYKTKSEPRIGMTAQQVIESTWGRPEKVNKTTYAGGTKEQWVYSGYKYIYFENGRVTAISE